MNVATGLPEWQMVACGKCRTCVASRKNDWTGRLVCEAKAAASVFFVTLTYKDEPERFVYKDVQVMLKSLRHQLNRKFNKNSVRFFCVGERGNKYGRRHWHLLLFFKNNHHIKRMKKGQLWEHWPHGWTSMERVWPNDLVRRVRYCSKYAVKSLGQEDMSCRPRCSLGTRIDCDTGERDSGPVGWAYLHEFARRTAEAGLPLGGFYRIPGLKWERGREKGNHIKYRLQGACARNVCEAYMRRWCEVRPDRPWPVTPFLARYGRWRYDCITEGKRETVFLHEWQERHERWPETRDPMVWSGAQGRLSFDDSRDPFGGYLSGRMTFDEYEEAISEKAGGTPESEWERWAAITYRNWEKSREAGERDRARKCASEGFDLADPEVQTFVKLGKALERANSEIFPRLEELSLQYGISWGGQVDWEAEHHRHKVEAYQRDAQRARDAIVATGAEPVEVVDPETGEVALVGSFGSEGVEVHIDPPIGTYTPRPGGLVARAIQAITNRKTVNQGKAA
ncbi:MAG: replication initiator protein [Arizlama microvirus]|nr:MAG: replication initiator protein [Arizlama microvirus]